MPIDATVADGVLVLRRPPTETAPAKVTAYPVEAVTRVDLTTSDDARAVLLGVALGVVVTGVAAGAFGVWYASAAP
jgi:hypothetical protein